jgi:hypothetical protein
MLRESIATTVWTCVSGLSVLLAASGSALACGTRGRSGSGEH